MKAFGAIAKNVGGNEGDERRYYVYAHILFDGRKYIGITKQKPQRRWRNGEAYKSQNPYFYHAIQKYGWDAFLHIIIDEGLSKEEAIQKEIELIAKYKTQERDHGFNLCAGGEGTTNPSEETRRKIGEASKKTNTGRKHTEEFKARMSERMKNNNPNAGGKAMTQDRIRKFAEYAKQPKTASQKQKMSESAKKQSVVIAETGEVFASIKELAEKLNIKYPTATSALYRGYAVCGLHLRRESNE